MFTVFGATGNTGSIVAERLLAAGKQVRAVVRSADKGAALAAKGATLVIGDVTDAKLVAQALAGAEGAYLLLPPDMAATDLIAKNRSVVDNYLAGLVAGKVPHAVFLSSVGAQLESGNGPIRASHYGEVTLPRATGTALTILRASAFMENVLGYAHPMKADGVLPVFGGGESYPFPMTATRDIGEVAAAALLAPATQVIELQGPRDYSYADAAAAATQILGRPVKATPVPIEAMVPTLTKLGISENVAGLLREMTEAFGRGLTFEGKGTRVRGKVELADVLRAGL
jgi:uncharacterized protein YbjT (DUF2867 family)